MQKDEPGISMAAAVKKAVRLTNEAYESRDAGLNVRITRGKQVVKELLS